MRNKITVIIALLVVIFYPVFINSNYYLNLGIMVGIWMLLSTSLNLVLGYTGQTPLGHTAFFGVGAFTAGILSVRYHVPLWATIPLGAIGAIIVGYLIGKITLKLRGAYFVLASLAFAQVLQLVAINWDKLTGGPSGLIGIAPINIPVLANWLGSMKSSYFLIWVLTGVLLLIVYRVINSSIGRSLVAISENERLAESIGIYVYRYTIGALLLSTGIAGIAGAFYAHYISFISPDLFTLSYTVTMLVMVISGGRRTFAGPLIGAIIFTILPELLRATASYQMSIYGIIIILTISYFPEGLLPFIQKKTRVLIHR